MSIELEGNWKRGIAFDVHTLSSTYLGVNEFGYDDWESTRSEIGELLYQLKFHADAQKVRDIVKLLEKIKGIESMHYLIPVPSTNQHRRVQPVVEIARALGEERGVEVLEDVLCKRTGGAELKNVTDVEEREGCVCADHDKDKEQKMNSVFVAGSRTLGRLNDQVRERLGNVIAGSYRVLVGDANGADKAVQSYFFERQYRNVVVFCSGNKCRNNLGAWPTQNVEVPSGLTGRAFYTCKDIEMAENADYGLMLWDGKSAGTMNNVLELVKRGKKALVYLSPKGAFFTVSSLSDLDVLLSHCASEDRDEIGKKVGLKTRLKELVPSSQCVLHF
jgi:hypothetical protein